MVYYNGGRSETHFVLPCQIPHPYVTLQGYLAFRNKFALSASEFVPTEQIRGLRNVSASEFVPPGTNPRTEQIRCHTGLDDDV